MQSTWSRSATDATRSTSAARFAKSAARIEGATFIAGGYVTGDQRRPTVVGAAGADDGGSADRRVRLSTNIPSVCASAGRRIAPPPRGPQRDTGGGPATHSA